MTNEMSNEEKIARYDEVVEFLKIYQPHQRVSASFLLRKLQETEEKRNEEAYRIFKSAFPDSSDKASEATVLDR